MKRLSHFFKEYYLFAGALLAVVLALPLQLSHQTNFAHFILAATATVELLPLLWGMWQDFRTGTYGLDILAAAAILSSVLMRQYWAAVVIVLMLTGGESLEDYANRRAQRELSALLKRAPQKAHVLRGRKTIDVLVREVVPGDKVIVKPGEIVPVDAIIIEGDASFDEASLTGESLPQVHDVSDTILSGSINLDGAVIARALHTAQESQYEQIIKLVQAASKSHTPFLRLADRYSVPFTIISFAIAITAWVTSHQSIRFLEVLVVATPCPLILAAPIAVISGMSRAARHGIIIKTGASLERLAQAKTFGFDKTGTLTRGELIVSSVKTFNGYNKSEVLGLAAGLERSSNHVLAQAIVAEALKSKVKIAKAKNVKEVAGKGIMAHIAGKDILVGRLAFMRQEDVHFPAKFNQNDLEQTAALVAIDGTLASVIICKDELRENAKATINHLRQLGIKNFLMVTGDNKTTALVVAKQTGIHKVVAEALPKDKLEAIEKVAERPVVFVGDGVNDAPVLTASDVGIALGARGSTAASESADVVVMQDDLNRVSAAVAIAKRSFHIARQSIFVGIGLSVALMLVYATGKFSPISGAVIQELVDVVVIFNALRAHFGKPGRELYEA
ncbi:MAG TPA: heavy metal translocating P-type ATPase [Candidatus Saccharimonadales bacterium]|nr:heavy metal translocating P-type ATPase [Candidatus Saccharimonadales bacterium]